MQYLLFFDTLSLSEMAQACRAYLRMGSHFASKAMGACSNQSFGERTGVTLCQKHLIRLSSTRLSSIHLADAPSPLSAQQTSPHTVGSYPLEKAYLEICKTSVNEYCISNPKPNSGERIKFLHKLPYNFKKCCIFCFFVV